MDVGGRLHLLDLFFLLVVFLAGLYDTYQELDEFLGILVDGFVRGSFDVIRLVEQQQLVGGFVSLFQGNVQFVDKVAGTFRKFGLANHGSYGCAASQQLFRQDMFSFFVTQVLVCFDDA